MVAVAASSAAIYSIDEERDENDDEAEGEVIPEVLPFQTRVRYAYNTAQVQMAIAAFIFTNFVISAVEAQMRPTPGSSALAAIRGLEIFFAVVFGVELLWNIYAHWFIFFWHSAWNVFDCAIVTITFVSLSEVPLPGVSVLRLFRAFRVFRLFKRVDSLKVIIDGVAASMPGVANAFMILGILMGIWAIIGVQFFAEFAPQEFGTFLRAMFTMWQVMTMDGWASGIARPLIFDVDQSGALAVIFFVSFTFVAGIVMANVVVAILLEKYLGATADNEVRKAKAASTERAHAAEKRSTESAKALDKTRAKDRLLDNDDIIDLITETVKRKNLQGLSKDDLISLALAVWHQPSMADNVPAVLRSNMRVAPQHQSRSILLNVMQRGIASTGAPGGGRIRRESTADFAFASSRAQ
ncbi:hypothetical protein KFE25_001968 [Diacronema lutheri]|uniref:Ion transport domain-containing protein n=1 Tax=Diacronema lutheri TaxID=2081491 RepID=A0A8J5XKS4_DIALT|nr:hypothetical protein KFE25_001968 [Diacronema lutheri]